MRAAGLWQQQVLDDATKTESVLTLFWHITMNIYIMNVQTMDIWIHISGGKGWDIGNGR